MCSRVTSSKMFLASAATNSVAAVHQDGVSFLLGTHCGANVYRV